jgi:hypothetical protein
MDRNFWLSLWAMAMVPIVYGLYVASAYHVALAHGNLPFLQTSEWRWFVALFVALGSGVTAIAFLSNSKGWVRVIRCASYFVLMGALLLVVDVVVACNNGDCL